MYEVVTQWWTVHKEKEEEREREGERDGERGKEREGGREGGGGGKRHIYIERARQIPRVSTLCEDD
jgi:hypothetical protein